MTERIPIGTRVVTPPVHGAPVTTTTASKPFRWGMTACVELAGLSGWWELNLLRRAPPESKPAP